MQRHGHHIVDPSKRLNKEMVNYDGRIMRLTQFADRAQSIKMNYNEQSPWSIPWVSPCCSKHQFPRRECGRAPTKSGTTLGKWSAWKTWWSTPCELRWQVRNGNKSPETNNQKSKIKLVPSWQQQFASLLRHCPTILIPPPPPQIEKLIKECWDPWRCFSGIVSFLWEIDREQREQKRAKKLIYLLGWKLSHVVFCNVS